MTWSNRVRQTHRWLAPLFTLGFVVNTVILFTLPAGEEPAAWVYFLALLPLFALFPTGLYLFALPYVSRWRRGRRTA